MRPATVGRLLWLVARLLRRTELAEHRWLLEALGLDLARAVPLRLLAESAVQLVLVVPLGLSAALVEAAQVLVVPRM